MKIVKTNFEKTAIIIHGTCEPEEYFNKSLSSSSNSHWLPWLQKQLLINGYLAQSPEMPNAYYPNYLEWEKLFNSFYINEKSLLIGHSCGAGFLLRWLSENKIKIKKLVLVAPWLDPNGEKDSDFFNFIIDTNITNRMEVSIFMSDNDAADIEKSLSMIKKSLSDFDLRVMKGLGHFCFSDMTTSSFH